ncbi:hypothetical protein XELAEV_18020790mg [Xenopus laevis]|uniref:Uncharacterized protein n=1 Tax=Xenopus laevis TaxID=8355 RepID=A0A974DAB9_XENLA|nr:hypothetical protein XELAEV_18020790mg [Xenopus laevis]
MSGISTHGSKIVRILDSYDQIFASMASLSLLYVPGLQPFCKQAAHTLMQPLQLDFHDSYNLTIVLYCISTFVKWGQQTSQILSVQ